MPKARKSVDNPNITECILLIANGTATKVNLALAKKKGITQRGIYKQIKRLLDDKIIKIKGTEHKRNIYEIDWGIIINLTFELCKNEINEKIRELEESNHKELLVGIGNLKEMREEIEKINLDFSESFKTDILINVLKVCFKKLIESQVTLPSFKALVTGQILAIGLYRTIFYNLRLHGLENFEKPIEILGLDDLPQEIQQKINVDEDLQKEKYQKKHRKEFELYKDIIKFTDFCRHYFIIMSLCENHGGYIISDFEKILKENHISNYFL